jgi:CHAT domain-containing protein
VGTIVHLRLGPLRPHLKGVDHIVVMPSPDLAGIPVEIMLAAEPDELSRIIGSYAPSASIFVHLKHRPPRKTPELSLLAIGEPDLEPDHFACLRRLLSPRTFPEAQAVAAVFGADRPTLLTGKQASERQVVRLARSGDLGRFSHIHFSTHGLADDDVAMNSLLALTPDPPSAKPGDAATSAEEFDGYLTAGQVTGTWKLDAELVVLSACQTGLGRVAGGEGFLGFARAFFVAGVRSLVLSQ